MEVYLKLDILHVQYFNTMEHNHVVMLAPCLPPPKGTSQYKSLKIMPALYPVLYTKAHFRCKGKNQLEYSLMLQCTYHCIHLLYFHSLQSFMSSFHNGDRRKRNSNLKRQIAWLVKQFYSERFLTFLTTEDSFDFSVTSRHIMVQSYPTFQS